jgi:hypothetical protein
MGKNGEMKQKGNLYQMGHNPFRSFYAGIFKRVASIICTLCVSNSACVLK